MTNATQKQKDAFADLLTAACYTNPVTQDVAPCRIIEVDALASKIYSIILVPQPSLQERADVVSSIGVFGNLYNTYTRLDTWTSQFFVSPNPPYQQQHITSLMGTALSVDKVLSAMSGRPHWNNTSVFDPISPDDQPPLSLMGGKYNVTWYEDLLGTITGTLEPQYTNISTSQTDLNNTPEYTTYINAVSLALSNIEDAEGAGPMSITDVANIIASSGVLTAYTSLDNQLITTLTTAGGIINAQINREQWWWHPLTGDAHFSQYSRASQVAVSGGVAISLSGMAVVPELNNMLNRIASPAMVLAKDE